MMTKEEDEEEPEPIDGLFAAMDAVNGMMRVLSKESESDSDGEEYRKMAKRIVQELQKIKESLDKEYMERIYEN